jgi:hypothetical protein
MSPREEDTKWKLGLSADKAGMTMLVWSMLIILTIVCAATAWAFIVFLQASK